MICDVTSYRSFTHDYDSYDGDVQEALENAQAEIEFLTDRKFESAARTENVRFSSNGYAYPKAQPVTAAAGYTIEHGYLVSDIWDSSDPVEMTYTGGYSESEMPTALKRLVADLAEAMLSYTAGRDSSVPAGATSIRVGDVQMSGPSLGSDAVMTSDIQRRIERWRRVTL